ncbi:HAD-IA family hydrolase [Pelomonas sp. KK5]|uniref:HAD-IA family hydrolase n=1 Tax=Pelomonas sp. KK5 TaxID=1855730 RepID=UPI00097BDAD4|nr:HAD-IA family hydrolase [Pelomonas sp. KK5]
MNGAAFAAVLFDLDGTLIDSAPDLAGAANDMRAARGLAPVAYELLRERCGSGARGMLGGAFDVAPGDERFEPLKHEFLDLYEARMLRHTRVFDEVAVLLQDLTLPWGIVTNKAERFALPIAAALGLHRAAAVVGGDTTGHTKPHPAPLLEAARRLGVEPARCLYVGDDERDVTAGRAAGMATAAVRWGYVGHGKPIEAWGADFLLSVPGELLKLLRVP